MGCGMSKTKNKAESCTETWGEDWGETGEHGLLYDPSWRPLEILVMGLPGSGKSTLLKQVRIAFMGGYLTEERKWFKQAVFDNTMQQMRALIEAMKPLGLVLEDPTKEHQANTILEQTTQTQNDSLSREIARAIEALWDDVAVQECFNRSKEGGLIEASTYFFDNVHRFAASDYLPNVHDILRLYDTSADSNEITLLYGWNPYRMREVNSWQTVPEQASHFGNVDAILFVFDTADYRRLPEAVDLFHSIVLSDSLSRKEVILLLNRTDVFQAKFSACSLANCFPDYEEGDDCEAAVDYVRNRFLDRVVQDETRGVYTYMSSTFDENATFRSMSQCFGAVGYLRLLF